MADFIVVPSAEEEKDNYDNLNNVCRSASKGIRKTSLYELERHDYYCIKLTCIRSILGNS